MVHDKIKNLLVGVLAGSMLTSGIAFARTGSQWIEAAYDNIKLYVNGVKIDTSYNEPFIYNGSTYLPVRAVAEALGQNVDWDGNTKSVYIGSKPSGSAYLMDVCPPYTGGLQADSLKMSGNLYSKGFTIYDGDLVLCNLNGKYNYLKCTIGHPDTYLNSRDSIITFYVDGNVVQETRLNDGELPKNITVPLNYGLQLKITASFEGYNSAIGIMNITVE